MIKSIFHIIILIVMISSIGRSSMEYYMEKDTLDISYDNEENQENKKESTLEFCIMTEIVSFYEKSPLSFGSATTLKHCSYLCRKSSFSGVDVLDPPESL